MRIGCFEVDLIWNNGFTVAEVGCGRARLPRAAALRNVRGGLDAWMRVTLMIDGCLHHEKSIRNVYDKNYTEKAEELSHALTLPDDLAPGIHKASVLFLSGTDRGEEHVIFRVYPANTAPTGFDQACFLPAWMSESDELRGFAAAAIGDAETAEARLRALYEALRQKRPAYSPVPTTTVSDCESVFSCEYTLEHGGSCMDLSLLMASLIRLAGERPALLMYPRHITVGCLTGDDPFDTDWDRKSILSRIERGTLLPVEVTGVCGGAERLDFAAARRSAAEFLKASHGCVLVDVTYALENYGLRPVMLTGDGVNEETEAQEPPARPRPPIAEGLRFRVTGNGCAVSGMGPGVMPPDFSMPETWQGRRVTLIAGQAFKGSRIRYIALPDGVTAIGEEAFLNCAALQAVILPERLTELGRCAFCGTGLREIALPATLEHIPYAAFFNCPDLESVTLPEGLKSIAANAFGNCPKLKAVRIPASVERIDANAFDASCEL